MDLQFVKISAAINSSGQLDFFNLVINDFDRVKPLDFLRDFPN